MAETRSGEDLERRIREADSRELIELLRQHRDELDVPTVRQALRNPFMTGEAIDLILDLRGLLGSYELRRDLALHPRTPEVAALRFVPGLYWRDLMRLGGEARVSPRIRQAADRHLGNRLPGLTMGERISLARVAGGGVLAQLRHDPQPQVFAALLQNTRLTEGLLMPVLNADRTPPEILEQIARSYRWGNRYSIRLALVRHPRVPVSRALGLLSTLKKGDLRALLKERGVRPPLRERIQLLLGLRPEQGKLTPGRRGE